MRIKAVSLVLLIFLQAMAGITTASTPETMSIDGDLSQWSQTDSTLQTDSNGVSLLTTWDSENLYFAWNGTDWASTSEGADLFIYFNTTLGGSVQVKIGISPIPCRSLQIMDLFWKIHHTTVC